MTPARWLLTTSTTLAVPAIVLGCGGDLRWVEAWLFSVWFVAYCGFVVAWLYRNNPGLLDERYRRPGTGGQDRRDVIFVRLFMVGYLAWNVGMPLDARRYRLSPPFPWQVEAMGGALLLVASFFLFRAFTDNNFLSPVVRIQSEREHRVVSTGVYGFVRHPMYLGAFALFFGGPLLLGSLLGMAVAVLIGVVTVLRILNEERVLVADLPGYDEYRRKVRYRLVPGIW
jgi:protein-S-isoprenylcysteine O-methyltransferase Ste14